MEAISYTFSKAISEQTFSEADSTFMSHKTIWCFPLFSSIGFILQNLSPDTANSHFLLESVRIKLQLWDTAGQERFRSITKAYYRNCAGCFIVYDITNRESFENARDWLYEAKQNTEDQDVVYLLVGHKVDLDHQREVTTSEGEAFANAHDMMFIETSAKILCNVEEAFISVTKEIYNRLLQGDISQKEGWDGIKTIPFRPGGLYLSNEDLSPPGDNSRRCCRS